MAHITLRVPPSLVEKVESLATYHGCRPSNVLRHVLEIGVTAMVQQLPPSPRRF